LKGEKTKVEVKLSELDVLVKENEILKQKQAESDAKI